MNNEKRPIPHSNDASPSVTPVPGEPVDVWDQVNKYGTYQVQDTTATDNVFPTIGYEGSEQAYLDGADKVVKKKPEP